MLIKSFHVSYTTLTMYLTNNQKQRDSATGFSKNKVAFI